MASVSQPIATNPITPITIKVVFEGSNRKFKLPLQDLNAGSFAERIRSILQIPENQRFVLERFSDSGNAYLVLDQNNPSAYKQLYRAAKAKLKLRIRATLISENTEGLEKDSHKRDQPTPEPLVEPLGSWLPRHPHSVPPKEHRPEEATAAAAPKDFGCLHGRDQFFHQLINLSREREMGRRMKEAPVQIPNSAWQIFCNECDKPLADAHFHCSICDGGDYDLCETCVEGGKTCQGDGHWLIKRFIKHGRVVNSTTETLPPKPRLPAYTEKNVPGAFTADAKVETPAQEPTRTCNSCVRVLPENDLCTCKDCPDFDLCLPCLETPHGHHPAHTFVPLAAPDYDDEYVAAMCAPGRNVRHHAICDGCDEHIFGVRHKCLKCPDWDFCNNCFASAHTSHPGHRFVEIYEPLEVAPTLRALHYGILCDGPLCAGKTGKAYIKGIRYKCAVCHDTDFCANCEAHPSNRHNETHPLVKFKTPVKGANITTVESMPGQPRNVMGDKTEGGVVSHARSPPMTAQLDASTQSTWKYPYLADLSKTDGKMKAVGTTMAIPKIIPSIAEAKATPISGGALDAYFVSDTIRDGTPMVSSMKFEQSWTIRNPGPHAWPIGCVVFNVGGDNMLPVPKGTYTDFQNSMKSAATTEVVEPGEELKFTVKLTAPARVGKHISYWRLKAPDGMPFGHKLWCDIDVFMPTIQDFTLHQGSALADYQMQLMLLEHQNKRRLMMARQEQDASVKAPATTTENVSSTAAAKPIDVPAPVDQVAQPTEQPTTTAAVHIENVVDADADGVMVFPTLEKESPASSTYQDATSARSTTTIEQPATTDAKNQATTEPMVVAAETETETESETVASAKQAEERFEDLESIEYEDSEDDGFMTDEEYDILDASDEEVLARGKSA